MEKNISYLTRNFDEYQEEFKKMTQKYYPQMMSDFQDASVGSWFIDLFAALGDELSNHVDRTFQEINIDSSQLRSTVLDMARNNGLKIPGKKCAMCEVEFSCELPVNGSYNADANLQLPNYDYSPLIKRGTLVSNGSVKFEVMADINFAEQFNEHGISDRIIEPKRNANGMIEKYIIKKLAVVVAGESKIYRKVVSESDIVPFMELILQDNNVVEIESIICKDGINFKTDPNINDFFIENEHVIANSKNGLSSDTYRYFEVDSLIDQYKFGDVLNSDGIPQGEEVQWTESDGTTVVSPFVYKGEWKPIKQKFITEFTNKGLMKIIFGSGYASPSLNNYEAKGYDTLYQISHMINNEYLGTIPSVGHTMFILYRVGGGQESNVAKGAINSIVYSNIDITGDGTCSATDIQTIADVRKSLKVTNTTPSIGGKDVPSIEEIKYLIKYNTSAQDRCITIKDYYSRIMKVPPKYGCPYRVSIAEENNKIAIYTLFTDFKKNLTNVLPNVLVDNLENYISEYRAINDFVEIKSGIVINLSFEIDMFISKSYNKGDVIKTVIDLVYEYMNIDKRQMGEDIFIGDLEKEISQTDGVISLIDLRVYNEYGSKYSSEQTSQERVTLSSCSYDGENSDEDVVTTSDKFQIDTKISDGVLYSDVDSMLEIKYKNSDIRIRVKIK